MSETELKPCLFCNNPDEFCVSGDDDDSSDDCTVECMFCYCQGPAKPTQVEATTAWNTRTADKKLEDAEYLLVNLRVKLLLLARLSADEPQFINLLQVQAAKSIRDEILKDNT